MRYLPQSPAPQDQVSDPIQLKTLVYPRCLLGLKQLKRRRVSQVAGTDRTQLKRRAFRRLIGQKRLKRRASLTAVAFQMLSLVSLEADTVQQWYQRRTFLRRLSEQRRAFGQRATRAHLHQLQTMLYSDFYQVKILSTTNVFQKTHI